MKQIVIGVAIAAMCLAGVSAYATVGNEIRCAVADNGTCLGEDTECQWDVSTGADGTPVITAVKWCITQSMQWSCGCYNRLQGSA